MVCLRSLQQVSLGCIRFGRSSQVHRFSKGGEGAHIDFGYSWKAWLSKAQVHERMQGFLAQQHLAESGAAPLDDIMQDNAGTDDAQGVEDEDSADDTASSHGASEVAELDVGTRALLDEAIAQVGSRANDAAKKPTLSQGESGREVGSVPSSPKTPPWTPPETVALTPPDLAEDAGAAPMGEIGKFRPPIQEGGEKFSKYSYYQNYKNYWNF